MKKIAILVTFMFIVSLSTIGCGVKRIDPNYLAYTQTVQAQLTADREPLVSIEVDVDGKISGVIVNQPIKHIAVEQKRSHPGWAAFSGVIKMCGVVGSIWATGDAITSIVEAGSGNTSYINSGNDNSGNSGSISSDYTDSTSTVTDTNTVTDTITTTN